MSTQKKRNLKHWTAKSFAVIEPVEMTINTKCGGFDKLNHRLFAMTSSTTACLLWHAQPLLFIFRQLWKNFSLVLLDFIS